MFCSPANIPGVRYAPCAVVERMTEFLGAAHQVTAKWQRVLEGMSAD